jgi:hypothetical protein
MMDALRLARHEGGNAAVEMALVMPLLLIILFGSVELGNYFMNEHRLVKAVRDGARFAARQSFANYTACSGSPGGSVVTDTKNVILRGYLSGSGTITTPNLTAADITVTTSCASTAGSQTMTGIYAGRPNGAQIVKVKANPSYLPILSAFGFSGIGVKLNASSEAAVAGI